MPQVSLRVDDHGVYLGLRKLAGELPQLTRRELDSVADNAKKEASGGWSGGSSYAVPQLPNQRYKRTGNYGRSVYWERHGQSYVMKADAVSPRGQPYAVPVGGNAAGSGQAWIHRGRWPLIAVVMAKWAQIAIDRMRAAVEQAIVDFGL